MNANTYREIHQLSRMTVGELREKYLNVFGEETRSRHKEFLRKRIARRIQALAEGGLSERAKRRAEEVANDADLRIRVTRDAITLGFAETEARSAITVSFLIFLQSLEAVELRLELRTNVSELG